MENGVLHIKKDDLTPEEIEKLREDWLNVMSGLPKCVLISNKSAYNLNLSEFEYYALLRKLEGGYNYGDERYMSDILLKLRLLYAGNR